MERGVVRLHVDAEARVLHRVEGVVLHDRHQVRLHATGEGRAELAEQDRVLAVGLLRTAPRRVPGQVDAYPAEEVRPLSASLESDRGADPLLELDVPRRTARHGHREGRRGAHHDAARPVRELEARDAEPVNPAHGVGRAVVPVPHQVRHPLPERDVAVEQEQPLVGGEQLEQLFGGIVEGAADADFADGVGERVGGRNRHGGDARPSRGLAGTG